MDFSKARKTMVDNQIRPNKINDRKTRKKLKWNNNYNLQMGVNETIEWYKSYENQFDVKDEKFIIKK